MAALHDPPDTGSLNSCNRDQHIDGAEQQARSVGQERSGRQRTSRAGEARSRLAQGSHALAAIAQDALHRHASYDQQAGPQVPALKQEAGTQQHGALRADLPAGGSSARQQQRPSSQRGAQPPADPHYHHDHADNGGKDGSGESGSMGDGSASSEGSALQHAVSSVGDKAWLLLLTTTQGFFKTCGLSKTHAGDCLAAGRRAGRTCLQPWGLHCSAT